MKRRWRTRYRHIGQIGTVSGLRIGGLLALSGDTSTRAPFCALCAATAALAVCPAGAATFPAHPAGV
jgi:hypothetical protein